MVPMKSLVIFEQLGSPGSTTPGKHQEKTVKIFLDTYIRPNVCMAPPMKHKFTLNIDEQLVEEIKIQAVREKRTVGEITEQLYREYLDRQVKVKVKPRSK